MKIDKNEIGVEVNKRHDVHRKTIGEDMSLQEIVDGTLQIMIEQLRPQLEKKLKNFESSQFKTHGKIELLNNIEDEL